MLASRRMSLSSRRRWGTQQRARRVSDDWCTFTREHERPVVVDGSDVYCVRGQLFDAWMMASLSDYVWLGDNQVTPHHGWRPPYGYDPIRPWTPAGHPWTLVEVDASADPRWIANEANYVQRKACPSDEPWIRFGIQYDSASRDGTYLGLELSSPRVYDMMRMVGY